MLKIFRRHTPSCTAGRKQHDKSFLRCNCTLHVIGSIVRGEYVRESLNTRDYQEASRLVRDAEARGYWRHETGRESTGPKTLESATEAFLTDAAQANGRNLREVTVARYRSELGKLLAYAGDVTLESIEPETLRRFRDTWRMGPRAAAGALCRLKAFFKFCVESEWIEKNPVLSIRVAKVKGSDNKKMPFTQEEVERILVASRQLHGEGSDVETLILLLRHSGLRISDAGFLRRSQIEGNCLRITTQKTRTNVDLPIPAWLTARLLKVEPKQEGGYLFAAGSLRLSTVTDLLRRKINDVFRRAGVVKATVHRFRHTFATELISSGMPIELVSRLLTHSSVTITERVYFTWIPKAQNRLRDELQRVWDLDNAA